MDFINVEVSHRVFKKGIITSVVQQYVTVQFYDFSDPKTFIQPDCFKGVLNIVENEVRKSYNIELEEKKKQERHEIEVEKERQNQIKKQQEREQSERNEILRKYTIERKEQEINQQYEKNQRYHQLFLSTLKSYGFEGFHHYTDFNNLYSIFECGYLYSRARIEEIITVDGAERSIIDHTPHHVKDSVRFYYKECTPTLFINEGIRNSMYMNDYIAHMPIPVLLLFDEKILFNREILISDGGCGNSDSLITKDLEIASTFDWKSIFKRGSYSVQSDVPDEKSYKKKISNTRNAEFLVPKEISLEYIKAVIFRSPADKKRAEFEFGPNQLYFVNHRKFNVKNGHPEGRNYLYDYEIIKTPKGFKVKLEFDSDPMHYTHKIRVHISIVGYYEKPLKLEINGNCGEFEFDLDHEYYMIEYALNDFVSAVWS